MRLRSFVWTLGLLLVGSLHCAQSQAREPRLVTSSLSAQDLRCEYAPAPLGIDVLQPRLSWVLNASQRGQRQTAYQILVSRSPAALARNKGDLWDSGKVSSDQSTQLVYAGQPLQSGQTCYWKVRAWDKDGGVSPYSSPASWEMGLLQPRDWHGQWIGYTPPPTAPLAPPAPKFALDNAFWIWYPEGDPLTNVPSETRYFRRLVTLPTERHLKTARLRIAADNGAVVYVNGKEIGRSNDSWKTVDIFDVTPALQPGTNVLAVSVHNDGTAAGLAVRLEAQFETGPPLEVVTDKSWKTSKQAIDGWQNVGTDDAAWLPAQEAVKVGGGPWGKLLDSAAPAALPAPPSPMLRRAFDVGRKIRRARAYICGLGYYELRLNGQKVGDHILDPGYTRYDRRDLYVTYDVTPYLKPGHNALGIILGTGWYDAHVLGVWDFDKAPWRARPEALLELRIEYEDGHTDTLTSDNHWQATTGPIIFDSIYAGENYDARLEKPGWDTAAYNAAHWAATNVVSAPKGKLVAQAMPPIKVAQILKPVKLTEPKPGVFLYDLGQNFAGLPQLTVNGPAGAKVEMRCGEKLHADGTLDQSNIDVFVKQRDPKMQFQTDTYILKGGGPEVWSPRFTYHGFQYVEMTGFPGRPTLDNLRGLVVHSAMPPAGHFECSNALLNAIQRNTLWSYLSNFESIPTDCPQREKNGWTGDAQLAAEQGMYNFDSAANYTKWLNDLEDEQRPNGELPGIVPSAGWGYGTGPAWDSAYPLICWYLYQYYGDARPLQQHYEHLRRYVDYLTGIAQGGIVSTGLGDWVAPGPTAPAAETDTAYYYQDALIVAQAATLHGKTDDARHYTELAASIKAAFNAKFYDPQTHSYADGSQTALSCALYQGLVEPEQREAVVQNLVAAIDKQDGHIFTGILGAKYVMNTLLDNDRTGVAYRIVTQKTAPGWGNWIERGATTLWEDWNGSSSLNHIMFGDISAWFYKALAGINGDPAAPGFKHFFIKPQVVGDLTSARGDYDSSHGKISSAWQVTNGQFSLTITVPVNTSATVFLPGTDATQVLESGRATAQADGVKLLRVEADHTLFEVGSGTYHFMVPMAHHAAS